MRPREITASYLRNFIFGVEDGLVSTVGLLSGIAIAAVPRETILLTGAILIFVEAFSMAIGSFLSESSAEEYEEYEDGADEKKTRRMSFRRSFLNGAIMFFSYLCAGFIPLFPYTVAQPAAALPFSIIASLVALFFLGLLSGKISRVNLLRAGLKTAVVGGMAIGVGVIVGSFIR